MRLNDLVSNTTRASRLPDIGNYLSRNAEPEAFQLPSSRVQVQSIESTNFQPVTISTSELFSSLEQFNLCVGDYRFVLSRKRLLGEKLTATESVNLARLNDIYSRLLSYRKSESADDQALESFVKEFGAYLGQGPALPRKQKL